MLSEKQTKDKLFKLADKFEVHFRSGDYPRAGICYDTARRIAAFMEIEEELEIELFGERGERGVILVPGRFKEEEVQKVSYECTIKWNEEYERMKKRREENGYKKSV